MSIEEKITKMIWRISTGTKPQNMTDDRHMYKLYTQQIMSFFRIEVECPECGGKGKHLGGTDRYGNRVFYPCSKCNKGKIIKPVEPDDVGRII